MMKVIGRTLEDLYFLFNDKFEEADETHEEYVWDAIKREYPLPVIVYQIKTDGSHELLQGKDILNSAFQYYNYLLEKGKNHYIADYEFAAYEIKEEDLSREVIESLQLTFEYCTDFLSK